MYYWNYFLLYFYYFFCEYVLDSFVFIIIYE